MDLNGTSSSTELVFSITGNSISCFEIVTFFHPLASILACLSSNRDKFGLRTSFSLRRSAYRVIHFLLRLLYSLLSTFHLALMSGKVTPSSKEERKGTFVSNPRSCSGWGTIILDWVANFEDWTILPCPRIVTPPYLGFPIYYYFIAISLLYYLYLFKIHHPSSHLQSHLVYFFLVSRNLQKS